MPTRGRPMIRFRADPPLAEAWRLLCAREGGAEEVVLAVVELAALTERRRGASRFFPWLRTQLAPTRRPTTPPAPRRSEPGSYVIRRLPPGYSGGTARYVDRGGDTDDMAAWARQVAALDELERMRER